MKSLTGKNVSLSGKYTQNYLNTNTGNNCQKY